MIQKYFKSKKFVKLFLALFFIIVMFFIIKTITTKNNTKNIQVINVATINNVVSSTVAASNNNQNEINLTSPIKDALTRITKKPFGIEVSPKNSPVSPERFSGYHTGVDFETTKEEANIDIPIYAVCSGELIYKNWVSGGGGTIIQSCTINNQDYTVVYMHIKLSSVKLKVGDKISAGDNIAILGKGYSTETDGERKHLHLAISKGSKINLLGYVKLESELSKWIDAQKYLK